MRDAVASLPATSTPVQAPQPRPPGLPTSQPPAWRVPSLPASSSAPASSTAPTAQHSASPLCVRLRHGILAVACMSCRHLRAMHVGVAIMTLPCPSHQCTAWQEDKQMTAASGTATVLWSLHVLRRALRRQSFIQVHTMACTEGGLRAQAGRWRRLCPACRRRAQAESQALHQQRHLRPQTVRRTHRMVRACNLCPSLRAEN